MTWIMAFIYPIIAILIIDDVRFVQYFTSTRAAFSSLGAKLSSLVTADILVLSSGFVGAILSGFTMRILRKKGYRMF